MSFTSAEALEIEAKIERDGLSGLSHDMLKTSEQSCQTVFHSWGRTMSSQHRSHIPRIVSPLRLPHAAAAPPPLVQESRINS